MSLTLVQHLAFARDLTCRVIDRVDSLSQLKEEYGVFLQNRYPSALQLPEAYRVLLSHLLNLGPVKLIPHQMPNGAALLDGLGIVEGGQLPNPLELAELGSLWMIVGVLTHDETLIYAGLKVALWQAHSLDHRAGSHLSLWVRATAYDKASFTSFHFLLFTVAYRLTNERAFLNLAQNYDTVERTPLVNRLLTLTPSMLENPKRMSYRPLTEEMTVGLLKHTTPQASFCCSLSGFNSGLFSYHKQKVAIVNGGPHSGPLDNLEAFGIDRSCSSKTSRFLETVWEKTAHHFRLKGWTKLHQSPLWMEADFFFQAQKINLSLFFQENHPLDRYRFVLYCACDAITLGGKTTLKARGLDKYQGKALPLELSTGDEHLIIESDRCPDMEVIPLAGGDHFWGADFLVAYQLSPSQQLTISSYAQK